MLTLKTAKGTFQNDWHFGFYKDMPLAALAVTHLADLSELAD